VTRQAAAIAVVAAAFALSFGVLCSETGLGLPMTVALSILVFAGSAQLAALVAWRRGSFLTIVAAAVVVTAAVRAIGG
jgi:predicted branched-subunit amino acid permease